MNQNPYRYEYPLDPEKDKLVCIPRTGEVHRVIGGIRTGDYWSILGPKQIGKTTFLHQVKKEFPHAYYIYVNLKNAPQKTANFYQHLIHALVDKIPCKRIKVNSPQWKKYSPELGFFEFLKALKPKHDSKKIIFLFDDIDDFPFLKTFLGLWRLVFQERRDYKALNKYTVAISGSQDLVTLTIRPNSPFNIAETITLKDFSKEESEKLIIEPMKHLNIEISPKAKEMILSQISGHPQLLQHTCYLLVEKAMKSNQDITDKIVEEVRKKLFATNASLCILKQDLEKDLKLNHLIRDILNGKKQRFHPYQGYSIAGAGPIVDHNSYCAIRNPVYEECIKNLLKNPKEKSSIPLRVPSCNFVAKNKDRKNDKKKSI